MRKRRTNTSNVVVPVPINYENEMFKTRAADGSWISEYLSKLDLDNTIGNSLRIIFRNKFLITCILYL